MVNKEMSFSDRAREITKKYKKRLGDDFSKKDKYAEEAMNRELEALKQEQESIRAEMFGKMEQNGMFATGGNIRKDYEPLTPLVAKNLNYQIPNPTVDEARTNLTGKEDYTVSYPSGDRPYSTSVSPLGVLPSLIGYGMNRRAIRDMSKLRYTPSQISPERISLAGARSSSEARGRERSNMLRRMSYSLSPSQRYARSVAGVTESDRITGEELGKSYLDESLTNSQYAQRAKEFNAGERSKSNQYNLGLSSQIAQAKLANNQGLVSGLSGYMSDIVRAKQYDSMLGLANDNIEPITPGSYYNQPLYKRSLDYITGRKPLSYRVRNQQYLS